MTLKEAIELLEYHLECCKGSVIWPVKHSKITEAINRVLKEVKDEKKQKQKIS